MWTPDKDKEEKELKKLIEIEKRKEALDPDYQQYMQLFQGNGFKK